MNVDWSHWLGRHKHGFCFCIFSFNSCPVNIMQDQPFLRVLAAGMCYLYAWNAKSLLNRTHDHIVEYWTIIVNSFLHYDHTKKFSIPGYTFDNNINYLFLIDSAFVNFVGIICSNCYYKRQLTPIFFEELWRNKFLYISTVSYSLIRLLF